MDDRLYRDIALPVVCSPQQHGMRRTPDPSALRHSCIVGRWTVLPPLEGGPHARPHPTAGPEGLAAYREHVQYAGVPAMVGLSKARRRVWCVTSLRGRVH